MWNWKWHQKAKTRKRRRKKIRTLDFWFGFSKWCSLSPFWHISDTPTWRELRIGRRKKWKFSANCTAAALFGFVEFIFIAHSNRFIAIVTFELWYFPNDRIHWEEKNTNARNVLKRERKIDAYDDDNANYSQNLARIKRLTVFTEDVKTYEWHRSMD